VAIRVDLGKGRELTASQLCERLGFGADGQWTPVGDLSGGERRRLQLTRLLMGAPNLLVLDEPTNDFDVETLAALEDLLDGFAGTLVVVSHDRYFTERVCDEVVALPGDGQLRPLPGGVEEYLLLRGGSAEPAGAAAAPERPATSPAVVSTAAADRETRKSLARIERQIERLRVQEAALHADLAEHATDFVRVTDLHDRLRVVEAERDALEEQWLTLAE
jgi:ATP-binding cassette subfamily F protein uup